MYTYEYFCQIIACILIWNPYKVLNNIIHRSTNHENSLSIIITVLLLSLQIIQKKTGSQEATSFRYVSFSINHFLIILHKSKKMNNMNHADFGFEQRSSRSKVFVFDVPYESIYLNPSEVRFRNKKDSFILACYGKFLNGQVITGL